MIVRLKPDTTFVPLLLARYFCVATFVPLLLARFAIEEHQR